MTKVRVATVASCVATWESDQPQQLEEVGKSPRLRNSVVLLNLETETGTFTNCKH